MRPFTVLTILLTASCHDKPRAATADPEPPGPPPSRAEPAEEPVFGKLRGAARCTDATSPLRVWCIAADGWSRGTPELPRPGVLLGLTVELEDGKPVEDALRDRVGLSALAVRGEGDRLFARITYVTPSNDGERDMIARAVGGLAAHFKETAATAAVARELVDYTATLEAQAAYPITKGAHGSFWTGASHAELRKVGKYWVALETSAPGQKPGGQWVTVFTDRIAAAR